MFRLRKMNKKLVLAIILSIISLYFLYDCVMPKEKRDIKFEKYVKAKVEIGVDDQIQEAMLEYDELPADKIPAGTVRDKKSVVGKYVTTTILTDELIRKEKIKKKIDSNEYKDKERIVRIYTTIQAYGGVGSGDRADLIYTKNNQDIGKIGLLKYEGVLVEEVINEDGINIERVESDKYNKGDTKPYIVTLKVSQKMALEIETLQETKEICFKLIRWTERSKKQSTENTKVNSNQIIDQGRYENSIIREVN